MNYRKLTIVLIAALFLCLASIPFAPTSSASPDDLHIFQPTIMVMDVEMDSSVVYRWGVYNDGNHSHTLLIDIEGGNLGWESSLSNSDSYFVIAPDEFITIELNITAPNTRDYPEDVVTLSATARDLVTEEEWTEELGTVTTTIVGGAYIPPTKVLGRFDNYLGDFVPALDNEWGVFISTVIVWLIIGAAISPKIAAKTLLMIEVFIFTPISLLASPSIKVTSST